ncbi:MerC domain-containing protein [Thalassotalea euphylliae]|uniref:MerC domain-containing protein n=1 Tax=Thalassotalea euphylliae TaxID=1655234 RepID=A0A3E0TUX8_9GAMM|nr:MerC domain-containing protein [Thalassotalea euphylliae]REL27735.1 MerC domain-containing protein [Thalassotalea euphylliae]
MKLLSISADKLAISLSMLCVLHCLALPLLLVVVPSLAVLPMAQESFHFWMVMAVLPTSIYALTLGCKKHRNTSVVAYGLAGLAALLAAVLLGEHLLGEVGEKLLTTIGASIIAVAHFKNFSLCRSHDKCACPAEQAS